MSSESNPARLLQAHDPALADLEDGLRQARARGPSADQQTRMRSALGLPARASESGQPSDESVRVASQPVARVPTWLKLFAGGALGLAAIGGVGAWRQLGAVERAVPVSMPLPKPAAVSAPVIVRSERSSSMEAVAPAPAVASPLPKQPATPPRVHPRAAAPHDRKLTGLAPHDAPDASATLTEELALLRRAKADAVSRPDRALALLDEHARRFAQGALAQEREVIAIEALLARGDRAQAEQRAARFLAQNPGSAHARRVRALLGAHARGAADFDTKPDRSPHPSL